MNTIKVTFIDNCSHGYYSVSKKDILKAGINPEQITRFSGMTLNRVYLEEDQDATLFFNEAEKAGLKIEVKDSYNPKFDLSHCYVSELFNWKPKLSDIVIINEAEHEITLIGKKNILVKELSTGSIYRVSLNNPFKYIRGLKTPSGN